MIYENINLGNNVDIISSEEDYTIFEMQNDTGKGAMTMYEIFPGIRLLYNDFHMQHCNSQFQSKNDMFCVDYCREGRIEWNMGNGTYRYMGAGDIRIDNRSSHNGCFEFPLNHYHGISISFYGDKAENSLKSVLVGFPVSINELCKKFHRNSDAFVLQSQPQIESIITQLYSTQINDIYFLKLKVLELLLHLSKIDISANIEEVPYFQKAQVKKVKSIEKYITSNLEKHYTLNELSEKFEIPLTTMKNCFKGVFGTSIYTYIRQYRMNSAAVKLIKTNDSILSIASSVGYESHSKFSGAFRKITGKSPLEYRKTIV